MSSSRVTYSPDLWEREGCCAGRAGWRGTWRRCHRSVGVQDEMWAGIWVGRGAIGLVFLSVGRPFWAGMQSGPARSRSRFSTAGPPGDSCGCYLTAVGRVARTLAGVLGSSGTRAEIRTESANDRSVSASSAACFCSWVITSETCPPCRSARYQ